MMAQLIDRRQVKLESRQLLRQASVSAVGMVTLLFLLHLVLNLVSSFGDTLENQILGTFLYILTYLMSLSVHPPSSCSWRAESWAWISHSAESAPGLDQVPSYDSSLIQSSQ